MQLVTYRRSNDSTSRVGVLVGETVVDVVDAARAQGDSGFLQKENSMLELFRLGHPGLDRVRSVVDQSVDLSSSPIGEVALDAPIPRPNSIRDFMLVEEHVKNSLGNVPEEWYTIPVHWKGNADTVIGPGSEAPWPHYTDKLDYELEVAAVLCEEAYQVSPEEALSCIGGYTIFNDWSARDIQFREMSVGIGPAFGKDFATSMGPCITTADSIDVLSASMTARVNGEVWSEGGLGSMIFSFAEVISLLSQDQPLHPGDVFGSGTIGRGCGLELDRWIQPGDLVELEVEGIGVLANTVGAKKSRSSKIIDLTKKA